MLDKEHYFITFLLNNIMQMNAQLSYVNVQRNTSRNVKITSRSCFLRHGAIIYIARANVDILLLEVLKALFITSCVALTPS